MTAHSESAWLQSWVSPCAVQPLAPLFAPLLALLLHKHAEESLARDKLHQCWAE